MNNGLGHGMKTTPTDTDVVTTGKAEVFIAATSIMFLRGPLGDGLPSLHPTPEGVHNVQRCGW